MCLPYGIIIYIFITYISRLTDAHGTLRKKANAANTRKLLLCSHDRKSLNRTRQNRKLQTIVSAIHSNPQIGATKYAFTHKQTNTRTQGGTLTSYLL